MAIALDYQTVYHKKKKKTVPISAQIFVSVLLFVALATKVWVKIECTEKGYALAKARKVAVALDIERRELELHKSILLKPDNVIMRSQRTLGLVALNPAQAIKITY